MATIIKVNDTELKGVKKYTYALDDSMIIELEKGKYSFDKLAEIFTEGAKIEATVGNSTSIYYNKVFNYIKYSNEVYEIQLGVSELQSDVEAALTDRADTSDGAIEDLAAMLADLEERVTALEGNGVESKTEEV